MNKIRVGVVGVGYIGELHARIYSSMDEVELVGVVDIDKKRADEMANKYNTVPYYDYHHILNKVDGVSIAVPTIYHYPIGLDFVKNNVDILMEKPITSTLSEADDLTANAISKGVILQVGHVERFNPAVQEMRKYITKPGFIEAHRIGPYVGRGIDVDVILDLMVHDIDIIMSIVDSEIIDIRAIGVPVLTERIDIANGRLEFASGCIANMTASRVSRERMRKIRIFQHDTYVSLDYAHQTLAIFTRTQEDGEIKIQSKEIRPSRKDILHEEVKAFINSIKTRTAPPVTGEDGKKALEVALRIIDDARRRL